MTSARKIPIVEDDANIANLLTLHLGEQGYDVDHAADGMRAVAMLAREAYDLIIPDIVLPELGGLEICRRSRQQHHNKISNRSKQAPFQPLKNRAGDLFSARRCWGRHGNSAGMSCHEPGGNLLPVVRFGFSVVLRDKTIRTSSLTRLHTSIRRTAV